MEERVLKVISILSVVLAMIVSISLQFFPEMHEKSVLAAETRANLLERGKKQVSDVIQDESGEGLLENGDIDIEAQLKIELPDGNLITGICDANQENAVYSFFSYGFTPVQ